MIKVIFNCATAIIRTTARVLVKIAFAAEDIVDQVTISTSQSLEAELEEAGKSRDDFDAEFEARLKRSAKTFD